eukprot:CAMPEP_0117537000 /NCGR_PEP_ID=MMETSP0784-20121206/41739_1 /TAXON_ID=39447 /ORGANISM="" /LENGTH=83 /DNA_ID=CAMNT_0005333573 /DNA_START=107 /DNA_END=354 /DNA_ORIENTATION=-
MLSILDSASLRIGFAYFGFYACRATGARGPVQRKLWWSTQWSECSMRRAMLWPACWDLLASRRLKDRGVTSQSDANDLRATSS